MNILSIDLASLYGFLMGLNLPRPDGGKPEVLVAIIPEYRADGRLDRLNVVTRPPFGKDQHVDKLYEQLTEAATAVIAERTRQHDAAVAKLKEPTIVSFDPRLR